MSANEPNTPTTPKTLDDALASIDTLQRSLKSARDDEKAAREKFRQFAQRIAEPLGVTTIEDREALAAQAVARLGEVEKVVGTRTAELQAQAKAAQDEASKIKAQWAGERIERALADAFERSGARPENREDFLALARPLFGVDDKGEVRTRADATNAVPGVDPAAFIHGQLRAKRPHWWPNSVGGGARPTALGVGVGAPDCFRPGSGTWNVTQQAAFEREHGTAAAFAAAARWGARPFWAGGRSN